MCYDLFNLFINLKKIEIYLHYNVYNSITNVDKDPKRMVVSDYYGNYD